MLDATTHTARYLFEIDGDDISPDEFGHARPRSEYDAARLVLDMIRALDLDAITVWRCDTDAPMRNVTEDTLRAAADLWAARAADGATPGDAPSPPAILAEHGAGGMIASHMREAAMDAEHERIERGLLRA